MKRLLSVLFLSMLMLLAMSGCADREQWKSDVLDALARHDEMNNYRFSGSADLHFDAPGDGWNSNPLMNALGAMLTKGTVEWQGVASKQPLQLEATLTFKPAGSNAAHEIPLLLKDNTMYIHIPVLNQDGQFFEIDLDALAEMAGQTADQDAASQIMSTVDQFFASAGEIAGWIDAKHFDSGKAGEGEQRIITATIDEKNKEEAVQLWQRLWPAASGQLQVDRMTLNEPLSVSVALDAQGFVRELRFVSDMTLQHNGTKRWQANIASRYADINANPPFTMAVPDETKPFTDLLKIMISNQTTP